MRIGKLYMSQKLNMILVGTTTSRTTKSTLSAYFFFQRSAVKLISLLLKSTRQNQGHRSEWARRTGGGEIVEQQAKATAGMQRQRPCSSPGFDPIQGFRPLYKSNASDDSSQGYIHSVLNKRLFKICGILSGSTSKFDISNVS